MAIGGSIVYPTIAQVTNLVRSLVGDDMAGATGTLGEGQIFPDNTALSVTQSNFFNAALSTLCRKLRTTTGPMLIYDNVLILGLPPLQSPTMGLAAADPSVQVWVGFTGYFNGVTVNSNYALPSNCLQVERVWERVNGSNDGFRPMAQPPQGLSSRNQGIYMHEWEWRNDAVNMRGSLETLDLRLRYQGTIVPIYNSGVNTATTYIPINDCANCLAGMVVQMIAMRQGAGTPQSPISPLSLQWANDEVNDFLNEWSKRDQGMPYTVQPFDGGDGRDYGLR